jgi:hypothetical protein
MGEAVPVQERGDQEEGGERKHADMRRRDAVPMPPREHRDQEHDAVGVRGTHERRVHGRLDLPREQLAGAFREQVEHDRGVDHDDGQQAGNGPRQAMDGIALSAHATSGGGERSSHHAVHSTS